MNITIYVRQKVSIPKASVALLEQRVREKWGMAADQEVNTEDLLIEADAAAIIDLPRYWKLELS